MRVERDLLGERVLADDVYYGIQTLRALENFPISGFRWPSIFIKSFALVKKACTLVNMELGYLDRDRGNAIVKACDELIDGKLHDQIVVDPFQGGAGTSTNMNFNEVIANRALELLGKRKGEYDYVHPLEHVNKHQSTNDVFPTASKVAILFELKELEAEIARLQEVFQKKESEFRNIVKLGRTELQDAVPITLGMEFSAYAEAIARDRWRIFKARERIKVVNLGGTAVGTGLGAPRDYIFRVTDVLRDLTGLNIARSENLVDATQNLDSYVEVSGLLKAYAVNLLKISSDLRFLSSGPDGGIGEIRLPAVQPGSTIMPGKVNPVIPEAVGQVSLRVIANDEIVSYAAGLGQLELNQFHPILTYSMLESLMILKNITRVFAERCVEGITPDETKCREYVEKSKTIATVLVPIFGYEKVKEIVEEAKRRGCTVIDVLIQDKLMDEKKVRDLLSPKRMYKLGFTEEDLNEFKS
uniref:Aspartate ammonia-lyase n=1 Tax=candidate division WOR-3 bacterium TaxID=2052148 RepID=A0A7V4E4G0_UNCW3